MSRNTRLPEFEGFLEKVARFDQVIHANQRDKAKFESRQKALVEQLDSDMQSLESAVDPKNPLKATIGHLAQILSDCFKALEQQVQYLKERLKFQEMFSERLIIIIYGKVNAGKSTFANYLVRALKEHLATQPQHFIVDQGNIIPSQDSEFKEGATETTSVIQGASIGNIVLLDSPGLHSVTQENGKLAENFTESADLILWLSSSVSPGQDMELESLSREMKKKKVLVPVITRSDRYDFDEVDGQVVKVLAMKKLKDRQAQQQDVAERTRRLFEERGFDVTALKDPVSMSVHFANENSVLEDIAEQSGMEMLFSRINTVYESVIEAKLVNARNQAENHLIQVRTQLKDEALFPALDEQLREIDQRKKCLDSHSQKISQSLLHQMYIDVEGLIDEAANRQDKEYLASGIEVILSKKLAELLQQELFDTFQSLVNAASNNLTVDVSVEENFRNLEIEYTELHGHGVKGGVEGAGVVIGAVAGSFIPGAGTVVGGLIGGLAGGAAGSLLGNQLVKEIRKQEVIGVDSVAVAQEINAKLESLVPGVVNQAMRNLLTHLEPLEHRIMKMKNTVETF
ncbi:MAG: hypothetical protein EA349_03735 [Halomonadaceae bacterium]|nr:MAG: hypothetical protein EA349_03735 [Halomonadaceae bacterium]